MANIIKVTDRAKLQPRREPYWQKISQGCYVGYRLMTAGAQGNWQARMNVDGRQQYKALSEVADLPPHQQYDAAVKSATAWFEHLGRGGQSEAITVLEACNRYVAHLRTTKGEKAAAGAQYRITRLVAGQRLAKVELDKLKPTDFAIWREATDGLICERGKTKGRARSPSSIARDTTALRSALNYAKDEGFVTSDFAWASKLKCKESGQRRGIYLDRAQRKLLLDACDPDIAKFVKALLLLPIRPGALAAMVVGDFDPRQQVLTVRKDKAHSGRRVYLPDITAEFFIEQCRDRLPAASIFTNTIGKPWKNQAWGFQFRRAADKAGLPKDVSLYSLRHATITDMIVAGADALTTAALAGTSIAMIQKHYGHLTQEHARSALERLALG